MDFKAIFDAAVGALTLKEDAFGKLNMEQGFVLLLTVGFILGCAAGVAEAVKGPSAPEEMVAEDMEGLEEMPSFIPYFDYYMKQMPKFVELAEKTEEMAQEKRNRALEIFGGTVVSGAFMFLSTWLLLGAFVYLTAQWLGGTANLQATLAATSLWVVPYLLKVFEEVPYIGPLLSVVAFLWGVLIYVQAIRVTHGLEKTKAALALLLPVAVPLIGLIVTVLVMMALLF